MIANWVQAAIGSFAGANLGDASALGDSCILGDAAAIFVLYMALRCCSTDVVVAMSCALVVETGRLVNICTSASATMMAASGADKDGLLQSRRKNSTVLRFVLLG
jgi:hypothetical protein